MYTLLESEIEGLNYMGCLHDVTPSPPQVSKMPWNDEELQAETGLISDKLSTINGQGVLTINSQPNLNGVSSNDPRIGWGAPNGYIYQKV